VCLPVNQFGVSIVIATGLMFLLLSCTSEPDLSALEKPLNAAGYQLFNPPRSNWGPGFVFSGDIVGGRLVNVGEVCPNLYGDEEPPRSAKILLPNYTAKDSLTFGAAVRFLRSAFGLDVDVDKVERERLIEVKWQNVSEMSYALMDNWLRDGTVKPIPIECRNAIQRLQGQQKFENRVFVLTRAIAPESLKYEFSAALNAKGSASADLWKVSEAKAQAEGGTANATQIEIPQMDSTYCDRQRHGEPLQCQRFYIGYAPPVKITEWIDTGQSSGELRKVKGEPTNFQLQ
jgi:hypothetical protein